MQPRERQLAIAIALLVVLWGGWAVYGWWSAQLSSRNLRLATLRSEIKEQKEVIRRGNEAQKKLDEWEKRSLPTDVERARSLYQNWLLALTDKAKFAGSDLAVQNLKLQKRQNSRDSKPIQGFAFTITAEAKLEQLVQFLFEFYSSGHLDRIRYLHVQPIDKSDKLKLSINVEALILPTTEREDKLSTEAGHRLVMTDLKDYRDVIVKRNLFAEYTPEKPIVATPPKVDKPPLDPATQAKFTGFTESGDKRQAWIRVFTTNQTLLLGEGDKIEVGTFKGTVTRVGERDIELAADGKRWLLAWGESLKDAVVIGEDKSPTPAPTATE
jgi:hypothetical protein